MMTVQIKILKTLGAYTEGQIVTLEADSSGSPVSRFWRRRLKDAPSDGFCRIVEAEKADPEAKNKPASPKKDRDSVTDEG